MSQVKEYLGDSVYVELEGGNLILTTEDGVSVSNRIILEPEVYGALAKFCARLGVMLRFGKK